MPELEFFRGIEPQDGKRRQGQADGRGALHDHVMIWVPGLLEKREVRQWAIRAGFGHSVDLVAIKPDSRQAAYYVSKYVVKAADSRQSVPWVIDMVDVETGELFEDVAVDARYRTWSQSRKWGTTMAAVRALCAVKAQELAAARQAAADTALMELLGGTFGPLEPVPDCLSPSP